MLGLLDPGGEDNVYEQLLAKINKNKLSADILTVTVVEALSKLVYVAKSKYDKAPPNMLSKRQFAHVLGYICRREMLLEEVPDAVIRNVWRPQKLERQMACNPNAAWDGLKIFGMDTPRLDEDEGVVALDNPPGTNSFQNYIYIYTSQMLCHIIIKWFITKCSVARREGDGAQHRGGGSDPWGEHLLCRRYTCAIHMTYI